MVGHLKHWIPPACTTLMGDLVAWNPVEVGLAFGLNRMGQGFYGCWNYYSEFTVYLHRNPEFSVFSKTATVIFQIIKTSPILHFSKCVGLFDPAFRINLVGANWSAWDVFCLFGHVHSYSCSHQHTQYFIFPVLVSMPFSIENDISSIWPRSSFLTLFDLLTKIWDVATGRLKLTLTGHIEQIRG